MHILHCHHLLALSVVSDELFFVHTISGQDEWISRLALQVHRELKPRS
jgi:hypothetical protein